MHKSSTSDFFDEQHGSFSLQPKHLQPAGNGRPHRPGPGAQQGAGTANSLPVGQFGSPASLRSDRTSLPVHRNREFPRQSRCSYLQSRLQCKRSFRASRKTLSQLFIRSTARIRNFRGNRSCHFLATLQLLSCDVCPSQLSHLKGAAQYSAIRTLLASAPVGDRNLLCPTRYLLLNRRYL